MNSFPKKQVVQACKRTILDIEQDKEATKTRVLSGHRQFGFFGRKLTPNEAFGKLSSWGQALLTMETRQELIAKRILDVAEHCLSDTINLSNDEFAMISSFWE